MLSSLQAACIKKSESWREVYVHLSIWPADATEHKTGRVTSIDYHHYALIQDDIQKGKTVSHNASFFSIFYITYMHMCKPLHSATGYGIGPCCRRPKIDTRNSTIKLEAANSSEIMVSIYITTRCHNRYVTYDHNFVPPFHGYESCTIVNILGIKSVHHPLFHLKHAVSETQFSLRSCVKTDVSALRRKEYSSCKI